MELQNKIGFHACDEITFSGKNDTNHTPQGLKNEWCSQKSMEGTQKLRENFQLDEAENVSLASNAENEFEINMEAGFWRR